MKTDTRNYAYWTCQIVGWGVYSALSFAAATAFAGWRPAIAIGFGLFFFYSVALTHALRRLILRRNWLAAPPAQGLPRVFGCAVAVGLVQTLLIVSISHLLTSASAFGVVGTAYTASSVVAVTCVWTAIYVGIIWNRRYRTAQLREVQFELSLRQAELRALQAQVNPHFLFNCLNTIRGMVVEDPERARQMITNLAGLLRRSLKSSETQMVPLAEEMEAVSDYLALETTRFEERLRVSLDVDSDAGACVLPSMLLQTLVENAVKHGISRLPAGGEVSVRGVKDRTSKDRTSLVLTVENTGKVAEPDPSAPHTGLDNARERLRLFCGERATLELSGRDGVVTATVVIPQPA